MLVTTHRTIRDALRHALESLGLEVITDAPPGREAVLAALTSHPHVALVDAANDPTAGIEACRLLHRDVPHVELVALATHAAATRQAVREAGAARVLSADIAVVQLATVLASVASGVARRGQRRARSPAKRPPTLVLSEREHEVLALAAAGLTDGQISSTLAISHKTVKNHLHHIYGKLGVRGRTDAVMLGVRRGLISL
jgi:DNA-binding NarL/FixJ family response regulator